MIHVATGLIVGSEKKILVAQRAPRAHLAGMWEFPGGKVEKDESFFQALVRELDEEVGIQVVKAHPLVDMFHDYGDKQVMLHALVVSEFLGEPRGCEGQPIRWATLAEIAELPLPDVNRKILEALENHWNAG